MRPQLTGRKNAITISVWLDLATSFLLLEIGAGGGVGGGGGCREEASRAEEK